MQQKNVPKTKKASSGKPTLITPRLLRGWPLPQPQEGGDKNTRGKVLVVGGSPEIPGAVLLAATAALRAGAGKLQIATGRSIALQVAMAVPEARVVGLPETLFGAIDVSAAGIIADLARNVDAVLIGPGMVDEDAVAALLQALLPRLGNATLILDAAALACPSGTPECLHHLGGNAILTPHATEMGLMLHREKDTVEADPLGTARSAASDLKATVALKGVDTYIATPEGIAYCNRAGNVGLATSGSGDTLAGVITGLAARGATPIHATVWGVYLHARAGDRLARRMGKLGFLARELLAEVPLVMREFDERKKT